MKNAIVFTHNLLAENFAKTAHGLLRGTERFKILAVIDSLNYGKDAGEVLDGNKVGIPVYKSIQHFIKNSTEKAEVCVVGVAFPGGVLPEDGRDEEDAPGGTQARPPAPVEQHQGATAPGGHQESARRYQGAAEYDHVGAAGQYPERPARHGPAMEQVLGLLGEAQTPWRGHAVPRGDGGFRRFLLRDPERRR